MTDFISGMPPIAEGWSYRCDPSLEWRPADKDHQAYSFMEKQFPNSTLAGFEHVQPEVTTIAVPVLYVMDAAGKFCADIRMEPRIFKDGAEPSTMMVMASQYWLIHRPKAAVLYDAGELQEAVRYASLDDTNVHRFVFMKARAQLEADEAMTAFETLFKHMSFNEELWRLEKLMAECLPFSLEGHPRMTRLRGLLTSQVGHLRGDKNRINGGATVEWYKNGSPIAGIDETYVNVAGCSMPTRLTWLVEECKKEGFKRVAEYGSVEGVNLFHLIKNAPEIDWQGFEVNPEAIERSKVLGEKTGAKVTINLMEDFGEGRHSSFDAVALFEVLEHNPPEYGMYLVRRCFDALRPGGILYITTPWGNWSGHDEHTRDLALRKDHIYAFTPERMKTFLAEALVLIPSTVLSVEGVENTNIREANGWVMARVKKP